MSSFLSSCDKEEPIPAYIHIPASILTVESDGSEGSNSHNITDAWVYVSGKFIGVYELPTTIPILTSGEQNLTILAGIKKNGLASERVAYPFYDSYSINHTFVPAQVDTITPEYTYRTNVNFPWLEDFEDQTISMQKSGSFTTIDSMKITGVSSQVFEYNATTSKYSGIVTMDTGFQIFENSTIQLFDLPRSGREIYLEFNYKSSSELIAGIYPITGTIVTGIPVVNFFPTNGSWKKAYVSLKEDVNNPEYLGFDFRIFFGSRTNTDNSTPQLFFDNIKLVHF